MFAPDLLRRAESLVSACRQKKLVLATAESCTGGLIAALLTEIPGSSAIFDRGFVTYSNEAKQTLLGVSEEILRLHGAVSEACARAMADGAIVNTPADIAVSVTGIAGPGGGSAGKPVGLVHFACSGREGDSHVERRFGAIGRERIRLAAVQQALLLLEQAVAHHRA